MLIHTCKGGQKSRAQTWREYDGRGIPLCIVCEDCCDEKLSKYDPKILGHYNENDVDERIEADE